MKFKELYQTYKDVRSHWQSLKVEQDTLSELGQTITSNLYSEVNQNLYQLGIIKVSLQNYKISEILDKVESCMQDIGTFDR
jgi:hypothetical protein